ncbi:hypothetical protein Dcar01_01510 [Deinococcus carri]|uniref:SARP family transcriptional regulator n=1 Tax=Deinococcus carri TaxID=1211323 RepID=A0ABP9W6Q4_9DEIO
MLTVQLLGHVHITHEGQVVPTSSKAAALLAYLVLEGRAHHREHLAGLLWDTADALRNLRVELARLRGQGVSPFPARLPMLTLHCATDLHGWLRQPLPQHERELAAWLSPLRGPALSGLEDLGTTAFQGWVDQQRSVIHDQIEERLDAARQRFEGQGQPEAAAQVRARAELLGLHLGPSLPEASPPAERPSALSSEPHPVQPPRDRPQGGELHFEWPEQLSALRQVLERGRQTPQLVLLQGHSGTRRQLLADVVQDTSWQAVHVQGSSQRPLLQAALAQRILGLLPPELRAQALPGDPDAALIRLTELLGQAGVPLLVAVHDVRRVPPWLMPVLKFLLDLPWPLVLVLSTTSAQYFADLRRALGPLGGPHQHAVTLPPLSVRGVMRALEAHEPPEAAATRHTRAARLVQRSEGWPLYARALMQEGSDLTGPGGDLRLPAHVRESLLSGLGDLRPEVREALARLAQLHDRFAPDLAAALLGELAPETLRAGIQAGLLLPAGSREALVLPDLHHRSNDAETSLAFASELLRSAVASTLPAAERHAVRCTLAALLLPTQPGLSHLYAERAGLPDLAAAARAALPALPAAEFRSAPALLVETPPTAPGLTRRECLTPNGYRVALDAGWLEVLRRGRQGPAPLLTLTLPESPAGDWSLTARLDVVDASPPPGISPPPFALGVRTAVGTRQVYSSGPLPDHDADGMTHTFGGVLPLGRWFCLSGQGQGGRPELSVRAVDVALTVGSLNWGGRDALPPQPRQTGRAAG